MTCEESHARGHIFWRATCDRPECYQVHLILHEFYYGQISKSDAKKILDEILDEDMLPYTENARNLIEQIYKEDAVEQIVPEQEIVEEESEPEVAIVEETEEEIPFLFVPEIDAEDIDENYILEEEV